MSIPLEWLFALLIVALYVHDAIALVPANEGWLEKRFRKRWTAVFPTRRFTWGGRHVLIPSLLQPWRVAYRLTWTMHAQPQAEPGWECKSPRLHLHQWLAAYAFFLVIVLLPLALLARAGDSVLLVLIVASYFIVVGTCLLLCVDARRLGLPKSACAKLALEMILCPPVAANLARRLALRAEVAEDFVVACHRLLPPKHWETAAAQIRARLEDEIETVDEGSELHQVLSRRKESIA